MVPIDWEMKKVSVIGMIQGSVILTIVVELIKQSVRITSLHRRGKGT